MIEVPQHILAAVNCLREVGYSIDVQVADGVVNLIFHNYRVPIGFSKPAPELLIKLPISYPNGKPDMFWTDVDLTLAGGQIPRSADQIEAALGKQWRRFSWHLVTWNPGTDDLLTYLEFINNRLAHAV